MSGVCCWSFQEDGVHSNDCFLVQIRDKDAEIERLRGDISYLESQNSKTIHRAATEIERLRSLLRESIRVPQQLNAGALSPVAWRKDYARRVREALGDD